MSLTKGDRHQRRFEAADALCAEFSGLHLAFPTTHCGPRIVLLVHQKWLAELELRLRQIGFRFIRIVPRGFFRVVSVIDMYR